MEIDNPKSAKMASPAKSKTELAKNGLPEDDMDSICGMLMQLQSEMGGQIRDPKMEDAGKRSMLRITREERAEAAAFGALVSVMFGEQDMKQKESAIKRILESGACLSEAKEHSTKDPSVIAQDGRGRTPLMYALAEASAPIIELILKCDRVDYLLRDRSGNTALMYACVRGYDSIVRLFMNEFKRKYRKDSATLLDYLDAENEDGDTAFTLALKNGHEDCAIALSEYLKEALEKEERRVTSLAYRMGLRGKSESRMQSSVSLKEAEMRKLESGNIDDVAGDQSPELPTKNRRRRSSASPMKSTINAFRGRRGRDLSRYYADEEDGLLESEETHSPKGSPERRRSSPVSQININLDLRVDHHHHYWHRHAKGRSNRSDKTKSQRKQTAKCEEPKRDEETK